MANCLKYDINEGTFQIPDSRTINQIEEMFL